MAALKDLRGRIRQLEDWWFDTTRRVKTAGDARRSRDAKLAGELRDSYVYLPVRVANARAALRDLPVKDLSQYTFIDVGSGKGRMLFVAAEYPFQRVVGVEFDAQLHLAAEKNIADWRSMRRRCAAIESVHANAAEYEFPAGPLVVYLFNPFGPGVMGRMLDNLERSLKQEPRHVVVLMLWPEHADVVAGRAWLRECVRTRRHCVFETAR